MGKQSPAVAAKSPPKRRPYVSQNDVPSCVIDDALRVPRALAEHYAYKPATPLNVAAAMDVQPSSGHFREITGAAAAYGLTDGGAYAEQISITPLGLRIVRPIEEGDDVLARREALLRPRIVGEFLRKYNNAPLPRSDIGINVLMEMGVPSDRAAKILEFIVTGAESVGMLRTIKDRKYVDITGGAEPVAAAVSSPISPDEPILAEPPLAISNETPRDTSPPPQAAPASSPQARRVFITHGKNKALLEPIKKLLGFGELEPVISVEKVSVSQPVPDKVMGEMRTCGAAIIHVDAEQTLIDKDANEQVVLNPNVLIEIGAAQALFGRRLILLVKEGVSLPSNVQGLFEVRYTGETLDGNATIRLLEAINDIKNHPMPDRYNAV